MIYCFRCNVQYSCSTMHTIHDEGMIWILEIGDTFCATRLWDGAVPAVQCINIDMCHTSMSIGQLSLHNVNLDFSRRWNNDSLLTVFWGGYVCLNGRDCHDPAKRQRVVLQQSNNGTETRRHGNSWDMQTLSVVRRMNGCAIRCYQ